MASRSQLDHATYEPTKEARYDARRPPIMRRAGLHHRLYRRGEIDAAQYTACEMYLDALEAEPWRVPDLSRVGGGGGRPHGGIPDRVVVAAAYVRAVEAVLGRDRMFFRTALYGGLICDLAGFIRRMPKELDKKAITACMARPVERRFRDLAVKIAIDNAF